MIETGRDDGVKRTFDTGATRDTAYDKLDYEAFLSPVVLERYAEYMNDNRVQKDGSLREGDDWQKGIPLKVYMKSKMRHFMMSWKLHRRGLYLRSEMEKALCGELFNTMGYLHEVLRGRDAVSAPPEKAPIFPVDPTEL